MLNLALLVHLDLYGSSSKVKVMGHSSGSQHEKCCFSAVDARYNVTYFFDVCRVLCAEVVGATSSEGFLGFMIFCCSSGSSVT